MLILFKIICPLSANAIFTFIGISCLLGHEFIFRISKYIARKAIIFSSQRLYFIKYIVFKHKDFRNSLLLNVLWDLCSRK